MLWGSSSSPVERPTMEKGQGLWLRATAESPTYSQHWLASHENERSPCGPSSPSWATLFQQGPPKFLTQTSCEQNEIAVWSYKLKTQQQIRQWCHNGHSEKELQIQPVKELFTSYVILPQIYSLVLYISPASSLESCGALKRNCSLPRT